jgi:hypothetical protein
LSKVVVLPVPGGPRISSTLSRILFKDAGPVVVEHQASSLLS